MTTVSAHKGPLRWRVVGKDDLTPALVDDSRTSDVSALANGQRQVRVRPPIDEVVPGFSDFRRDARAFVGFCPKAPNLGEGS